MKKEILEWPNYGVEEKRKKYKEFASNEFNFFAYMKDREFFLSVVLPHVKEKPYKSFWDKFFLNHDLSDYLHSWNYQSLNIFEKILLCSFYFSPIPTSTLLPSAISPIITIIKTITKTIIITAIMTYIIY
jgi:hypothetical protein